MTLPSASSSSTSLPTLQLVFTGTEINQLLGISTVTRWRLEKRGLLMPVDGLRRKLYSRASVEAFINRTKAK